MPKEKNQHKSAAASDEKFRDFFTTTVADIPAEMVRREEEAAEEHKGLFGRLFGHAKPRQAPQAGADLELPTGEVLLGTDSLAKPDGEEPLDLDLTLRTADPGTDFPQPKAEVPAAPEKPAVPDRPAPQPAPENKPEPPKAPAAPAPQPAAPRPETPAQSAAAPGPAPAPAARPEASKPAPQPVRRPLISGTSLSELLASAGSNPDEEPSEQETAEPEVATIDPECERKLERAREKILNLIRERRPRFVPAFELMRVQGNTISLSVPTSELREEILRSKTGMLMRIAELAGIEGMIELEVTVNEEIRAARPIKLEDRVRYITEKNPLVAELRKALDLEVE